MRPGVPRAAILLLLFATAAGRSTAAEVPVRYTEGVIHGFLVLRDLSGTQIAQGDLFQVARGGEVDAHMVFRFNDGSLFDEAVVFTQDRVFKMKSYHLAQRGPAFPEDTEISMERATGKYRVKTESHGDRRAKVHEGRLDLPGDLYNGMVLVVAKNLLDGASATVHIAAFTPEPKIIELEIQPANNQKVLVGNLEKVAVHFVLKPRLGIWLKLFATVLGRVPPDEHAWIVSSEAPAFVRFEGPIFPSGPVWRIELTSPRWPG